MNWAEGNRPYILLDVDGVINFYPRNRTAGAILADAKYWGGTVQVCVNPAAGPALLALAEETGAELAWATMWEEWANISIGPLLGLPELPFAPALPDNAGELEWRDGGFGYAKARLVVPWTQGRPFVWFDDEQGTIAEMSVLAQGQQHLPVQVDDSEGLTPAHISAARAWLVSLHERSRLSPSQ